MSNEFIEAFDFAHLLIASMVILAILRRAA